MAKKMERVPSTAYLLVSRLAGVVGGLCLLLALITGLVKWSGLTKEFLLVARPSTLVLTAIAFFLIAIWAVLYELRDCGIKTRL